MNMRYFFIGLLLLTPLVSLAADKININTASSEELQTLVGIGEAKAADIIAYREASGLFATIEDIMKVFGIKEATFAKIKDFITVGDHDPAAGNDPGPSSSSPSLTVEDTLLTQSSPVDLSSDTVSSPLTVTIGRERFVATGSELSLRAVARGLTKKSTTGADYFWNFGDGTASHGPLQSHVYTYPGTYNVIMDLTQDDNEAVTRTVVHVLDPTIKLTRVVLAGQPAIEVKNLAGSEVNLGTWHLAAGDQIKVLPPDTILAKGGALATPFAASSSVSLVAPSGQVFASLMDQEQAAVLEKARNDLATVLALLNKLQTRQLAAAPISTESSLAPATTTSAVATVELAPKRSWWQAGMGFLGTLLP